MSYDPLVREVESELLHLAQREAEDWETVRWLGWVSDCFDGGDYDPEKFGDLRYRLDVLRDRISPKRVERLITICQRVIDGPRAQQRGEWGKWKSLGNLYSAVPPVR